jgi:hypothetical protein
MAGTDTFIFRAALQGSAAIYRDIELDPVKSLYVLAEAVVSSFNFDFDHAFGFYTGLTPAKIHKTFPKYELFADMGDADPQVLSVKKTRMSQAFPEVGHTMLFLFDYGDDWLFRVTLRTVGRRAPRPGIRASSQNVARLLCNTLPMMTIPTTGRASESIPSQVKKYGLKNSRNRRVGHRPVRRGPMREGGNATHPFAIRKTMGFASAFARATTDKSLYPSYPRRLFLEHLLEQPLRPLEPLVGENHRLHLADGIEDHPLFVQAAEHAPIHALPCPVAVMQGYIEQSQCRVVDLVLVDGHREPLIARCSGHIIPGCAGRNDAAVRCWHKEV